MYESGWKYLKDGEGSRFATDKMIEYYEDKLKAVRYAIAAIEREKHAHWIDAREDETDPFMWCCSGCGRENKLARTYCHVCGAKMDEESDS